MKQFLYLTFSFLIIQNTYSLYPRNKFEWGGGFVSFSGNSYRGSSNHKTFFFPLPYFSYRGEVIEAETSFVRGTFYENSFMSAKLSFIFGPDVDSKETEREGMPDLDYTFELGPMFIFKLWNSSSTNNKLSLEIPFRQVFSTDFSYVDDIGYFTIPFLRFVSEPYEKNKDFGIEYTVGAMFASKEYHNYFYEVTPENVSQSRPLYRSRAGYSGTQFAIVLNKKFGNLLWLPFIRYDYLKGVAFKDSPLVNKEHFLWAGMGLFYIF